MGVVYASAGLNHGSGPSGETVLYVLNAADGSVGWQLTTPGRDRFCLADRKNVAYVTVEAPSDDPTQHNGLQARNASDGALLWHTQLAGTGDLAATVADDTLYLASFDSNRYHYDEHRWTAFYTLGSANGTIRWHRMFSASNPQIRRRNTNEWGLFSLRTCSKGGSATAPALPYTRVPTRLGPLAPNVQRRRPRA